MNEKRFMDVGELSKYLGVSKWMVYKLVENREIPFIPFGRIVRFDRVAVERWAEKKTVRNCGQAKRVSSAALKLAEHLIELGSVAAQEEPEEEQPSELLAHA